MPQVRDTNQRRDATAAFPFMCQHRGRGKGKGVGEGVESEIELGGGGRCCGQLRGRRFIVCSCRCSLAGCA